MIQVLTSHERYGPLISIQIQWNLILAKSDSLPHCKNTEITDVSIFVFYCYFITEAPKGSRRKKIIFLPNMHFKRVTLYAIVS